MKMHLELISTLEGLQELCERLKDVPVLAFDTEFIRESTFYPKFEILQIATSDESYLVDIQALSTEKVGPRYLPPEPVKVALRGVFTSPKILKVLHAAQGDQECLATTFGFTASPTQDTAILASLLGYGDAVGLSTLLKQILGVQLQKGHSRTNWSQRPLPAELLEYAHADVIYLVELAQKLLLEAEKLGRVEWARELATKFEVLELYEPSAEELSDRLARGGRLDLKGQGALRELVRWRERRVRELNIPRRWVAEDSVLVDMAQAKPKRVDQLHTFRGLSKGEVKHQGEQILRAIEKGLTSPPETRFKRERVDPPSHGEIQLTELLKCYLAILADREGVAVRHLATTGQILSLIRAVSSGEVKVPGDWLEKSYLSASASQLIGAELLALLLGQRALSVSNGTLKIVELASQSRDH
jgi:ribonuclease D